MKLISGLATLVSIAAAAPSMVDRASSPLNVKLEKAGNSAIKATISNVGHEDLRIFRPGSIFDSSSVEKAKVKAGDREIGFAGIRKRVSTSKIADASFQHISAGQSIVVTFDIAATHDLSAGGDFHVVSAGKLMIAGKSGDNKIVKSLPYQSNVLETKIDGAQAAAVRAKANKQWKRTNVQSDCTGERLSVTEQALQNCGAASSGPAEKMEEFFKASDSNTRNTVAGVFSRVAEECGSTSSGASTYYCTDVGNYCESNVLAYTDQATTNLHECTHLTEIQGTDDLGYGYDAILQLSASEELNNADTYAVFANSLYAGC
ncbi:hypothetical protein ACCO45_004431 [Purpureocillium lilacinum]|uniref:Uncharacterized protein n=1 Tax=Purpureocillium lilacinum TaxID=33203 RepID=A0ACC4E3K2_PURLI